MKKNLLPITASLALPVAEAGPAPHSQSAHSAQSEAASALKKSQALRALLKAERLQHQPRLTQAALSTLLGYPYSIVAGWENGARNLYTSQFQAWATALGLDQARQDGLLAEYAGLILPDEQSGIATGSRMDEETNVRMKALRKRLNYSMREMADMTGISLGQLQRVEKNAGNLTIAHIRDIHRRLRVSYEWLLEGKGDGSDENTLLTENQRLRREVELLENFRQQTLRLQQEEGCHK